MNGTVPVNPEKGEVGLYVKGSNGDVLETYVLHYSTNACARLESLLGEKDVLGRVTPIPIEKLMPRITKPGFTDVRAMLCAGLGDRHEGISLEAAGVIADRVGIKVVSAALGQAIKLAFPDVFGEPEKPAGPVKGGKAEGRANGKGSSGTRRKLVSAPPASGN